MPFSVPKRILNAAIGRGVDVLQYEADIRRRIAMLIVRLAKDIGADVLASGLDTLNPTLRERRLRDLFERVDDRIGGGYEYIGDVFSDNMKGLVRVSADGIVSDINRILGGDLLHRIEWTDPMLSRLVDGTLIHGAKSSEWWERQGDGYSMAFQDQIRMGMARGETILELRNRIMPVMPNGMPNVDLRSEPDLGKRDIVRKARRDAEALVRTSALTVCREAQLDVFEENADVIGGVEWLSTLDDRTTPLCRALDGLEWSIPDYEPKGHNTPWPGTSPHWNCRSIVVPVTKTWEELAKEAGGDSEHAKRLDEAMEDVPESVRASMGGPVPGGTTYSQWFDEQPEARQREILGERGFEAYERGTPLDKLGMAPRGADVLQRDMQAEPVQNSQAFQIDPERFRGWFTNPDSDFIMLDLPQRVRETLGTEATSLVFSAETLAKQKTSHPDISTEEYVRAINNLAKFSEAIPTTDNHIAFIVEEQQMWAAIIKKTMDGRNAYLVSLHGLSSKSLDQFRKKWGRK